MRFLRRLFARHEAEPTCAPMREHVRHTIFPVPGLNQNDDGSPWSDPRDEERNGAPFPHCDELVLHRPGTCDVCDLYPRSQGARLWMGVAFTNDPIPHPLGFMGCPALERRGIGVINSWYGNRPQ